jgi:predicted nucleotidyltransferase
MNISDADKVTILAWAERHTEIEEVWLYGSRARGDNRPDSDIDLAVVMGFGDWMFWYEAYKAAPDLHLAHPVHLEWYHPDADDLERVGPGVRKDGILLYTRRNAG